MTEITYQHTSVLMAEAIESLSIKKDGIYVDATFGRGGHAQAILSHLGPTGRLLAMDKDPEAIAHACQLFSHDERFQIRHGSFSKMNAFLTDLGQLGKVDGILFDLGVSSPQIDNPARGFSFQASGKLDMRMDSSSGVDAATWIAKIDEKALADTLWLLGEERFSRRVARAIVIEREIEPITTTTRLAEIIAKAIPIREKGKNPATRSFQAIRIAVNHELDDLRVGLDQALEALKVGGRLVAISFHSLEDRIVKQFIQQHERTDQFPAGLPVKFSDFEKARLKKIGKAIKPSHQETAKNPRARSAVLRIAEKQS